MSKMLYEKIKRILDICLSVILLSISIPLIIIVSVCIWLEDKGEVFLSKPMRIGLNGIPFLMYKFRSMIPNAHEKIKNDPQYSNIRNKWKKPGNKLKINEDPRITKIGKLIRKIDIDELPQLLNVLKGDMSIIGPRPMYGEELEIYLKDNPSDIKYIKNIQKVKPGMTGIWQVSGRNDLTFKERIKLESNYAQNVNPLDDLRIFIKTPIVVLTRKGAHE